MRPGDLPPIARGRAFGLVGSHVRRSIILHAVVAAVLALSVVIVTPREASARTTPPDIPGVVDLGPQMVQPWGQPPANSTFSQGLWTSNRDCGVSTGLSNGRRLWVYCDTSMFDQKLVHKANSASNTAALESPLNNKVVQDYFPWGNVTQFIPTQTFYPCTGYRATWPSSITTLPDVDNNPNTDRVIIFFQNNCIDLATGALTYYEIGVAEFDYNSSKFPPYKATVLNPSLMPHFDGQDFQFGATVAPDGFGNTHLYLYSCAPGGSCYVKRVLVSKDAASDWLRLQDGNQYSSWMGTTWGSGAPGPLFTGGGEAEATGDGISVGYVPAIGRYVMSYTPFPVLQHLAAIRTAPRPEGPWSEPVTFELPGCDVSQSCYAANVQPQLADATHIGISYVHYNDFVGWMPAPRNYSRIHLLKVPWVPPRTAAVVQNNIEFVFEIHNGALAYEYLWQGTWAKWFPLGGTTTWIGEPAVAKYPDNSMAVFATAGDGSVSVMRQGSDSQFGAPVLLANNIVSNGELAAASLPNGCLELFTTDATGRVFQIYQQVVNGTCTWSTLGFWPVSASSTFRASKGIAAATSQDGRVDLFGADSTGRINHTWQSVPNGVESWAGDFTPVNSSSFRSARGIAATTEFDGRIHVFAIDAYGQILHTWQSTPNGFTSWTSLGYWPLPSAGSPGGISASRGANGLVTVYAINRDMVTEQRAVESTVSTPSPMTSFASF